MSNKCFTCLAKKGKSLDKKAELDDFLWPWPDLNKFVDEVFTCI